ncbi:hypothetical protein FB451DRAFT_1372324 [Mycena latifolia]|nr:hypothetical protein FB451DRAFT_1372324 [Mycena latifolia]
MENFGIFWVHVYKTYGLSGGLCQFESVFGGEANQQQKAGSAEKAKGGRAARKQRKNNGKYYFAIRAKIVSGGPTYGYGFYQRHLSFDISADRSRPCGGKGSGTWPLTFPASISSFLHPSLLDSAPLFSGLPPPPPPPAARRKPLCDDWEDDDDDYSADNQRIWDDACISVPPPPNAQAPMPVLLIPGVPPAPTARPFPAADAARLGLLSRVIPGSRAEVVSAALELAGTIAAKSPVTVSGTKRGLLHARNHSGPENLEYTAI